MKTKRELIAAVAEKNCITQTAAERIIEDTFSYIQESLVEHTGVNIPGFGKFDAVYRASRTAHSPITGETISVASHFSVKFTPSKQLKESVR